MKKRAELSVDEILYTLDGQGKGCLSGVLFLLVFLDITAYGTFGYL